MTEANSNLKKLEPCRRCCPRLLLSVLKLCFAAGGFLSATHEHFIFSAVAFTFVEFSSWRFAVATQITSTASPAVCAGSCVGTAATGSASRARREVFLRLPHEDVNQRHWGNHLTDLSFTRYVPNVKTEREIYADSLRCFSGDLHTCWKQQRPSALFALLAPDTLPEANDWKANEVDEGHLLLEQETAATPGGSTKTRDYSWGTRKSSYSRVRLVEGSGQLSINGRSGGEYLQDNPWWIHNCIAPLMELNIHRKYDIIAEVHGGGLGGQSGAIMLAVARELVRQDPEKRVQLRRAGFLTVDARRVARKKFGLRKARKREQYSKR